jgi:hypothetical protein
VSTQRTVDPRTDAGLWPRIERCHDCHLEVVVARFEDATIVALEPWPVIVGVKVCPNCRGKGARTIREYAKAGPLRFAGPGDLEGVTTKGSMTSCPACGGTGQRGEELDDAHVVMRLDGTCRDLPALKESWDSAYRRHVCVP